MSWHLDRNPADPATPRPDADPQLAPTGQRTAQQSYVRCDGEGEDVALAFPYDAAMVAQARAIEGRRFDRDAGANVFPFTSLPQVVALADAHGIPVPPQVRALLPAARRARQHTAPPDARTSRAGPVRPPNPAGARATARPAARAADTAEDDGDDDPGASVGPALRDAAHLYLSHGLLPVPGWAASPGGCCCPRGAGCPRPGKHPRSVRAGPGPRDCSWKPLACATHEDVERRFAEDGEYAVANLMLAILDGMLVIDQDDDDGGAEAITALAGTLGELPATLSHRTPHGAHRIYRTPPGWAGRAWVGKDARNPLPAGIDLRVPGQILMAPPSLVPAPGGLAGYGTVTDLGVVDLPAAYVAAWTPPHDQVRAARPRVPVPPGHADVAASYVHARISGIVADLAGREPGGRNTAIYTAALKVGSTLGAAWSTPGAEHAAGAWTVEVAEDALMAAAGRNSYIADHSAAEARSAVRSGLRNGLRSPRPLPDFNSRPVPAAAQPRRVRTPDRPGRDRRAQPQSACPHRAPGQGPGSAQLVQSPETSGRDWPTAENLSAVLRSAGDKPGGPGRQVSDGLEGNWVPSSPDGGIAIYHSAVADEVNAFRASERMDQMPDGYACTLENAGSELTRSAAGRLATRGAASDQRGRGPASGDPEHDARMRANRPSAAANAAYRAADLDRARQLNDQAASLDPARADLWQRHRTEIDARRLFNEAKAAQAAGDHARAQQLIGDARQLDPRMRMLWDQDLSAMDGSHDPAALDRPAPGSHRVGGHVREVGAKRDASQVTGPQWPGRPALRRNPTGPGGAPQRAAARDASAVPGTSTPPHERQEADPDGQPYRACEGASSARPPDWRDTVIDTERQLWQPQATQPEGAAACEAEATGPQIST